MSVVQVYAENMYMKSKSEELNWRRQPEPHLTLHPEDKHGILEPNVDPVAQRSQKKADASVLRNVALFFLFPVPHMRHLSRLGEIIKQ
jgi:hypothetical protein